MEINFKDYDAILVRDKNGVPVVAITQNHIDIHPDYKNELVKDLPEQAKL